MAGLGFILSCMLIWMWFEPEKFGKFIRSIVEGYKKG